MANNIENMILKMERARAQLNSAVDKVIPITEIYPTWKVKQLMDHITGWDQLVYVTLLAYSQGDDPVMKVSDGIDHFNAESVSARKDISLEQSRQDYDSARRNVIQILRQLPAEMLTKRYPAPWGGTCTVAGIVGIFVEHEQEHARQIEVVIG
jgi:hypothetical protein